MKALFHIQFKLFQLLGKIIFFRKAYLSFFFYHPLLHFLEALQKQLKMLSVSVWLFVTVGWMFQLPNPLHDYLVEVLPPVVAHLLPSSEVPGMFRQEIEDTHHISD